MDSHDVRREWAERTGEFSPAYYAHYGPDETSERLGELVDRHADAGREATVLELGCGCGRHLDHLRESGYEDLHGIEINDAAFDVMAEEYPELADAGTFHLDAIEDTVDGFADDAFDVVYSVQTLQHVHPDAADVFAELARITGDLLVTAEREESVDGDGGDVSYVDGEFPLYFRNWRDVFTDLGLSQVAGTEGKRTTVRVFRTDD